MSCGPSAGTTPPDSMYVDPAARGTGVSVAILWRLESDARGYGWKRLVLETGERQPDAMRFYEREGYHPIPSSRAVTRNRSRHDLGRGEKPAKVHPATPPERSRPGGPVAKKPAATDAAATTEAVGPTPSAEAQQSPTLAPPNPADLAAGAPPKRSNKRLVLAITLPIAGPHHRRRRPRRRLRLGGRPAFPRERGLRFPGRPRAGSRRGRGRAPRPSPDIRSHPRHRRRLRRARGPPHRAPHHRGDGDRRPG